jgi:hypothetical protein
MSEKNNSKKNTFRVIPSKLIFISFSHAFSLIVVGHIIVAILSGIGSLQFIPFLIITICVFILMSLAVLVQIKNTFYSVYPDKLLFKVGLRKERKILWNEIERIKHVPFKPFYKHQFKLFSKNDSEKIGLNLSFIDIKNFNSTVVNTVNSNESVVQFFDSYKT